MGKILWMLTLVIALCHAQIFKMELNKWQFSVGKWDKWYPAKIPSTLTDDLIDNGIIPKDIYFRDNFLSLYAYQTQNVTYRSSFTVHTQYLSFGSHILDFNGLDTHCDVFLNNKRILTSRNMFIRTKVEVQLLATNFIEVRFNSSAVHDMQMAEIFYKQRGFHLPANFSFTRKPAYQYGWDWGPRILTVGIWKPVIVSCFNSIAEIVDVRVTHSEVPKKDSVPIDMTAEFGIDYNKKWNWKNLTAKMSVSKDGKVLVSTSKVIDKIFVRESLAVRLTGNTTSYVWWTWDLGNPTVLTVEISLSDGTDTIIKSIMTGIRTVKVNQIKDKEGVSFVFNLNGVDVFMRGGNYIPPQMSMARVQPSKYQQTIKDALFSKYNMLRVWGGGQFQSDIFYELCDKNGILIWHDLMFACAMYSPTYLTDSNLTQEIRQNVYRIDNHPSLGLWNGNNEVWIGWNEWGWQKGLNEMQKAFGYDEYNKLFMDIIPNAIKSTGSSNFYWQTSPSSSSNSPSTIKSGDIHFWRVWGAGTPIEEYEDYVGRFNSEYGMQSLPSIQTIQLFTNPSDRANDSLVMRLHQRHPYGDKYLPMYTAYAGITTNLTRYTYYSQVMQSYALQMAIRALRGNRPSCMGSLYWQLNDVWPCSTWATVDYYGIYKASHYMVRQMHSPYLISALHDKTNENYQVYVVNDLPRQFDSQNEISVIDFNGTVISTILLERTVFALNKVLLKNIFVEEKYLNRSFLHMKSITTEKEVTSENIYFFVKPANRLVKDPVLSISQKVMSDRTTVSISAVKLATYVWVRFKQGTTSIGKNLNQNYFHILPGATVTLDIMGSNPSYQVTTYELQALKDQKSSISVLQM